MSPPGGSKWQHPVGFFRLFEPNLIEMKLYQNGVLHASNTTKNPYQLNLFLLCYDFIHCTYYNLNV